MSYVKNNEREIVEDYASNVANVVPIGTHNVYTISKMIEVSYINDYTPPLDKKYGFLGGVVYEKEDKLRVLSNADYCILQESACTDEINCPIEMLESLSKDFKQYIVYNDIDKSKILVYKRIRRIIRDRYVDKREIQTGF